jgi:hypothetical protein
VPTQEELPVKRRYRWSRSTGRGGADGEEETTGGYEVPTQEKLPVKRRYRWASSTDS